MGLSSRSDVLWKWSSILGLCTTDIINKISVQEKWTGDIYNLETEQGFFYANNIAVKNCRCTMRPVIPR